MTGPTPSDRLDARYGRTRGRRLRGRALALLAGIAVLVVSGAWVVWVGLASPDAQLESRDLGFRLSDDRVSVRWELNSPVDRPARCVVQALDDDKTVVGWRTVDIPASDRRVRHFTDTVRTVEPPVTGLIWRCWLT